VTVKHLRGPGFGFSVPAGWTVRHGAGVLSAQSGKSVVSATAFTLLKPYAPALFGKAAAELDRNAAQLAAQAHTKLSEKLTTTVAGRKVRAYRYTAGGFDTRLGFVLAGRREVQLLCRAPAGSADTDGACGLLFRSFRLRAA
jgi:predicted Zn-dependent protease